MIRAEIRGGACRFVITVEAACEDGRHVSLKVEGDCPQVLEMIRALGIVDAYQVLGVPLKDTCIAQLAAEHRLHTSCIVPVGVLKAIEAAAGLALPAESGVVLARIEQSGDGLF